MNTTKAKKAAQARKALGTIPLELAQLDGMSHNDLCEKYLEIFGEPTRSRNKEFLRKKIGLRIQQSAGDGLTEKDQARLAEIHAKAPIELAPSRPRKKRDGAPAEAPTAPVRPVKGRDPRLPPPGTVLKKAHNGVEHEVKVLEEGFEYQGQPYRSLSKVAGVITGTNWNGFLWFGLTARAEGKGSRP